MYLLALLATAILLLFLHRRRVHPPQTLGDGYTMQTNNGKTTIHYNQTLVLTLKPGDYHTLPNGTTVKPFRGGAIAIFPTSKVCSQVET